MNETGPMPRLPSSHTRRGAAWFAGAALGVGALLLAGCQLQVRNLAPARQLALEARAGSVGEATPGSIYLGWRVFQERCARCHGAAAEGGAGSAGGPNLLARMSELGPRRFAALVLTRYDWDDARAGSGTDDSAREDRVDAVMQRRAGVADMPAWQDEPRVKAHVMDLYEYLAARAAGTLGPGAPPRPGP